MMEQDLKQEIADIKSELKQISKNTHSGLWRSFLTGTVSGIGSIVGVAIALIIFGYILNAVGIIPAFRAQVHKWNGYLDYLMQNR